jgi:hypothetical protein
MVYRALSRLLDGGLGLSRTSPALSSAAYLAASAATHIAMRKGPEAFRPFDGPSSDALRPQWEALHSEWGDLWKPELKKVNPERLGHIAGAQGVFARHEAKDRFDTLLASYDATSVRGRSARAPLLSCACRPASAWLDTLALTHGKAGHHDVIVHWVPRGQLQLGSFVDEGL